MTYGVKHNIKNIISTYSYDDSNLTTPNEKNNIFVLSLLPLSCNACDGGS